jgi:ketosteroid isomerase-like protein
MPARLKISFPPDCAHAPRKTLLKNLNIAFAKGDVNGLLAWVAEDVVWTLVGDQRVEGKAAMAAMLDRMAKHKPKELVISKVITHGPAAAVNGLLVFSDGTRVHFCDVYRFAGASAKAKIKEITSYNIRALGGR